MSLSTSQQSLFYSIMNEINFDFICTTEDSSLEKDADQELYIDLVLEPLVEKKYSDIKKTFDTPISSDSVVGLLLFVESIVQTILEKCNIDISTCFNKLENNLEAFNALPTIPFPVSNNDIPDFSIATPTPETKLSSSA